VDRIFYTAEIIAINLVCYTSKRSWFEAFEDLQLNDAGELSTWTAFSTVSPVDVDSFVPWVG
jgi:hypothetical protein